MPCKKKEKIPIKQSTYTINSHEFKKQYDWYINRMKEISNVVIRSSNKKK